MIKCIRRILRDFEDRGGNYSRRIRANASRFVRRNDEQRDVATTILRLQYLHLFLLCYPRAFHYRSYRSMDLYNNFCRLTCELFVQIQENLPQQYMRTIILLINISEQMVLNDHLLWLDWYDFHKCYRCGQIRHNFQEMYHPVLICLATRYKLSRAQIAAQVGFATMCQCPPSRNDFYR